MTRHSPILKVRWLLLALLLISPARVRAHTAPTGAQPENLRAWPTAVRQETVQARRAGIQRMPVQAHNAREQQIDTLALDAHTRFLSGDRLAGRGTGTPGARTAAVYIARQLDELGIPAAAPGGRYLQDLPLRRVEVDREMTNVSIVHESDASTRAPDTAPTNDSGMASPARESTGPLRFSAGEHFLVNIGGPGAFRDFSGAAIFVGSADVAKTGLDGVGSLDDRVIVLQIGRAHV